MKYEGTLICTLFAAKDKDLRARQAVLEMGRVELEDKHLGLVEENFVSTVAVR